MTGITSYGAYIPRLRLQRKAVAQANAWFAPNMMGAARGERSMANWDEDAVTMSVEAARDCIPAQDPIKDRAFVDGLYFASTTMPFSDRQNAGIVAGALSLGSGITSLDISSSQRAGTSALLAALDGVASGRVKAPLVVAGEKRKARAASSQELAYGDAAAAFTLGKDKVIAKFLGSHSVTLDFVDHFRGGDEDYDYGWEERWIRDEGYSKIVPAAIKTLLEKSGVSGGDIAHLILPCPFAKLDQALSKQSGIDPAKGPDPVDVIVALRDRAKTLKEMAEKARVWYAPIEHYDDAAVAKHLKTPTARAALEAAHAQLAALSEWSVENVHAAIEAAAQSIGEGMGKVAQPLRVALTGTQVSPSIDHTAFLAGRDEALRRIEAALTRVG